MDHPLRRPATLGLVLVLALTLLVASPRTASAHDSCAIPAPAAEGLLGTVVAVVNVFSSFLPSEADCPEKYRDVDAKIARDFTVEAETAATTRGVGGRERTYAPCIRGMAAGMFPCDNINMLAHVSHEELGTTFVNDIWGWTDPRTRKDYALVGSSSGTVFVDISNSRYPEVLGILPTASTVGGSSWRDVKVFDDHAYVVSEHTNHGVQVFDLTRLRDWDGSYTTYEADARYTGHGSAHNININEDTGYAYSVGAGAFSSQEQPNTFSVGDDDYLASGADWGTPLTQQPLDGDIIAIGEGCEPITEDLSGAIALADRGSCNFTVKAFNAQEAGAAGIVIANNQPGDPFNLGGSDDAVTIPAVMISQASGDAVKAALPASGSLLANDPEPLCGTGLHMIDINDPKNPQFAGCHDDNGYVHDTQCVVYEGPDAEHRGREICFNSNGLSYSTNPNANFFSVVDVTDKENPETLSVLPYEGSGYSHQGWLTEDQAWFLHGDEGDEQLRGVNTTTRVWDVSDLDEPFVDNVFVNDTTSIDHNLYPEGDIAHASNYTTGLRLYDASDPGSGLEEVGYFDLYPENDAATFEGGTWSNYSFFRQPNVVAVSSIDRGLFILQTRVRGTR